MRIQQIGLEGMQRSMAKLESAAKSLTAANRQPQQPLQDTVDLSGAMVTMIKDQRTFEASAAIVRTGNEMDRKLLDVIA